MARTVLARADQRTARRGGHAGRADAVGDRVPVPLAARAARGPDGVIHRALALNNTTWADADQIWASEGGAGGVIFIRDSGGNTLVVKPNIRGVEEQLSADVHHEMAATNKAKSWKLGELPMRIAIQGDITAIRQRADELWVGQRPQRLIDLLAAMAPGTTMIQESAPQDSKTLGRAMSDQAEAGGHFGTGFRQKVQDTSPLKPLFTKPEFAETLGRAAAADIFMGNFDRLVGTLGNIENLMVESGTKQVFLIDNIGANVSRDVFDTGNGQAEFTAWANNAWVAALKAGQVGTIAANAWSNDAPDLGALMTLQTMLVTGARADQQGQQHGFVSQTDQVTMNAKLTAKNNKLLEQIRSNFASGLTAGLIRLAVKGPSIAAGAGTQNAKRMAEARHLFLVGGKGVAAAWQEASVTYP